MTSFDLFGAPIAPPRPKPDAFTASLPKARPMLKPEKPHAMPRTVEIEIRDNARLLCRKDKDGYSEGARPKRHGGTPSGATSPGFNALMGWGDKAPVNGMMQAAVAYDTAPARKLRVIRGA